LDATSAGALLAERAGHPVAREVCEQLLTRAGGNPLALVELPTVLSPEQLLGTDPLPARLPVTTGMERVFLQRCRRLSEEVQTLLLVAAADDSGQLATVRRAAGLLGVLPSALAEAERSGLLLSDGDSVRVRHPVVRSALYQAATGLERRQAHQALAEALGEAGDADRSAWHRAAAAEGPDEDVVAGLERAASRAERRGGYVAAAAGYLRAAELTADEQPRAARLFAAGRNAWTGGRTTEAGRLAEQARGLADDRVLRADIDRLRGRIAYTLGSAPDGHRILMHAARSVAADDPVRALEMAAVATVLAVYGGDSGASVQGAPLSTEVTATDTPRARCIKQLLIGMTDAGRGNWATAAAPLHAALRDGVGLGDQDLLANLGATALHFGDDAAAIACFTAMIAEGRDSGAGMLVLYALPRLVFAQLLTGQWTAARGSAGEALALSSSAGQAPLTGAPLALLTLLAARQGNPEYDALLARLEAVTATQPLGILAGPVGDVTHWAKGTRAATDGDTGAAFHHLAQLRLPAIRRMAAVDRIDAAVRAGDRGEATTWVHELAAFTEGTGWPWAQAVVDHGRALLADTAQAPALFERALAHHSHAARPYDRARTQLAYGEFLRRSRRRVDARTHLRQALEIFEDLHAEPFATRAAAELRASGETAHKRDPSTLTKLTPMERQVAQLVSQGMSNREVAAQCWVSPRTVEFHLRNLFTKTGVTSRGALAHLDLG
jgi:DNA-binding CsgD family transcriptional regulator